jgi:hypothetical protein
MISFDLECGDGHKFEGIFRDYESFSLSETKELIDERIGAVSLPDVEKLDN